MTIVDSTVWIDYFRGRETLETDWLDAHVSTDPIGLTDLILCEVLQGVRDERLLPKLQKDLSAFHLSFANTRSASVQGHVAAL